MSEFFQPPPPPEEFRRRERSSWGPPPRGVLPGVVAVELLLGRSNTAAIYVAGLEAYPSGFTFELKAMTVAGGRVGITDDVFGRHWPVVGEKSDELPSHLLRIGVQYADGRKATNITGHSEPPGGPVMWPLGGGASGGSFHQGYWVSPLPPLGPVVLVCEWPAVGIPVARHEVDAQVILDAAERARAIFDDDELGHGGVSSSTVTFIGDP